MNKKIFILFLMSVLVLSGCSSSDSEPISTDQVDVNFVEAPQELWDESTTNSLSSQNTQNNGSPTVDYILDEKLEIYDIVQKQKKLSSFGEPKVNKIKKSEEDRFNVPLQFLAFPDEGPGPIIAEDDFDIIHTSNLDSPYAQIYNHKYTIHPSDNNSEIKTVLYSNADGSRISMIEKYDKSDEAGYTDDINYFQFIHNERKELTYLLTYEDARSKDAEPRDIGFYRINIEDDTIKKAGVVDIEKDARIGKFAAVKDLSNENMSGVFHYKSSYLEEGSEFYASADTISDYINGYRGVSSHQEYGYIESFRNHDFQSEENKENYPSENQVADFYGKIPSFSEISWNKIEFDVENMEYEGTTLIEALGIVD